MSGFGITIHLPFLILQITGKFCRKGPNLLIQMSKDRTGFILTRIFLELAVDVPFLPIRSGMLGVSKRGLSPVASGRLATNALKSDALG